MGVDYDGVGGIGIEFTDEMAEKFIEKGLFTKDEWNKFSEECMEKIGLPFSEAGSGNYGGESRIYLMVEGGTLNDILANEKDFLDKLNEAGINVNRDDLQVISDLLIW